MAQPTKTEMQSMDWVFEGQPFLGQDIDTLIINNMDCVFEGQPYLVNTFSGLLKVCIQIIE